MRKVSRFIVFFSFIFNGYVNNSERSTNGISSFPDPVVPRSWELPEDMTWNDYEPVPGIDWRDADIEPERVL